MGCFPFFKRARNAIVNLFRRSNNKVIPINIPENKIFETNEDKAFTVVEVEPQFNSPKAEMKTEVTQNKTGEDSVALAPNPSANKNDIVTVEDLTLE